MEGRQAVGDHLGPDHVAIALDDSVAFSLLQSFFGKESGVYSAVSDPGAAGARQLADRIAAEGVAGMDADANDVACMDGGGIDLLEAFVNQVKGAGRWRSGCGKNE